MSGLTNYFRTRALTVLLGTDFAGISALWLGLFTVNPTDDGSAGGTTDETEGSLSRVQILQVSDPSLPYFVEEEDPVTANNGRRLRLVNDLEYTGTTTTTELAGGPETFVGAGVYTASTAGTLLLWGPLDSSKLITAGDFYVFQSGDIIFQLRKDV